MFAPPVARSQTKTAANSTKKLAPQRWKLVARRFGDGTGEHAHRLPSMFANPAQALLLPEQTRSEAGKDPGGDHEQEAALENMTVRQASPGVAWST